MFATKFNYFESSSLFYNNCHSLYFCSITVTVVMVRAMGRDFSGAVHSQCRMAIPSYFHIAPLLLTVPALHADHL